MGRDGNIRKSTGGAVMTDFGPQKEPASLARLLAQQRSMTDAERDEQRLSFATGNVGMSNVSVTREVVEKAAERMRRDSGWHYCPDWDFLLVGPGTPEMEACCCKLSIKERCYDAAGNPG